MCSRNDDPTWWIEGSQIRDPEPLLRPDPATWAYHTANGTPLRGPCSDRECRYMSAPGGGTHEGLHSWQDGTTGWPHDYGVACSCPDCAGERRVTGRDTYLRYVHGGDLHVCGDWRCHA